MVVEPESQFPRRERSAAVLKWVQVLWTSFWVAGVAEVLFFTVINPRELYLFGDPVRFTPIATYSLGFFAFWLLCATSSSVTLFFLRSADDINRQGDL